VQNGETTVSDQPARPRAIIHLDLDAFYAAVEVLENKDLRGKPLIVGWRSSRGVVATASYAARAFGVRSAMPMTQALSLCPRAIVVPPRHKLYRTYSQRVMAILREVTNLVEQVSIDEAYLDLTDRLADWAKGVGVARDLQARVRREVGLSASLGVATNKLVAKVASDRDKPGGLTVVQPGDEASFLAPLPVRALWGVGPVTAESLAKMGVERIGDLAQLPEGVLRERFGRHGEHMARQAQGIDTRAVVTERETKSISQETTFERDLVDVKALRDQLRELSQGVAQRLQRAELAAGTVAIKLRYADFSTLTRQSTLATPTDEERLIYRTALALFERTWERGRPVRLLGVAGRQLCAPVGQLPLF
jgi:DNA polymerase-4